MKAGFETNAYKVWKVLDDEGAMMNCRIVELTGLGQPQVMTALKWLINNGYAQNFKAEGPNLTMRVHYAVTTKLYKMQRMPNVYRQVIAWHCNDGTCFIFPSVADYCAARGISSAHVFTSLHRGHRVRGERIEKLEYVKCFER